MPKSNSTACRLFSYKVKSHRKEIFLIVREVTWLVVTHTYCSQCSLSTENLSSEDEEYQCPVILAILFR